MGGAYGDGVSVVGAGVVTDARVEPLRNFAQWEKSLRNFAGWLGPVVSGGSDIDFICERNHQFLVVEAKPYVHGIEMGYGQHLLLYRLARQPNTTLYLVGEDGDYVHVVDYATPIGPKVFRRGGKPIVKWEPDRCEKMTRKKFQTLVEAWWNDATGEA